MYVTMCYTGEPGSEYIGVFAWGEPGYEVLTVKKLEEYIIELEDQLKDAKLILAELKKGD